jgi:hypothetical protein
MEIGEGYGKIEGDREVAKERGEGKGKSRRGI